MAPKHLIRAVLAVSIGALVAPAAASAAWTAPFDLSTSGESAFAPRVATEDDGDSVIAWYRFDGANTRVEAVTRTAAGVLGTPQRLSRAGQPASDVEVAVDAAGNAVFTWLRSDGTNDLVQARSLSATGTLSRIRTLSDPGHDAWEPQVAVDDDGDAVFAWRRSDGTDFRIEAATLSAAGTLSAPAVLSDSGEDAVRPKVAITGAGDAVLTWTRWDGDDWRVQSATRPAGGAFTAPVNRSDDGGDALYPDVDIDEDGDAYFAWQRWDGTDYRIQTLLLSAAGTPGVTHTVSDAGENGSGSAVAVDDRGDAVIAWSLTGSDRLVQAAKMSPADTIGVPETLSDAGEDAVIPHADVDDDGDGVITWSRFDGSVNRIQAATLAANGQFGAPETLSDAGEYGRGGDVAVDADGDAVVVWGRSDGTDERVQYSAGP